MPWLGSAASAEWLAGHTPATRKATTTSRFSIRDSSFLPLTPELPATPVAGGSAGPAFAAEFEGRILVLPKGGAGGHIDHRSADRHLSFCNVVRFPRPLRTGQTAKL